MGYIFEPEVLHAIARQAVGLSYQSMVEVVVEGLRKHYPGHIAHQQERIFNNAGGAMGVLALLHGSMSEYIHIFGTPIGTEGHSGRYRTEVYDFMLDGEMWCYLPGEFERTVYRAGDVAYLGKSAAKGYRIPDHTWILEYARGPIMFMLPFGLADTLLSTLDFYTARRTLWVYSKMAVRELFTRRKI
jgi:C-8 sterol isomerase